MHSFHQFAILSTFEIVFLFAVSPVNAIHIRSQDNYVFVEDISQTCVMGTVISHKFVLYYGNLDKAGNFLFSRHVLPTTHLDRMPSLLSNRIRRPFFAIQQNKPVYEYRSGRLVPGVLSVTNHYDVYNFIPDVGGTIITFKDYTYHPNQRQIYNLPGEFMKESEFKKLQERQELLRKQSRAIEKGQSEGKQSSQLKQERVGFFHSLALVLPKGAIVNKEKYVYIAELGPDYYVFREVDEKPQTEASWDRTFKGVVRYDGRLMRLGTSGPFRNACLCRFRKVRRPRRRFTVLATYSQRCLRMNRSMNSVPSG